MRNLLKPKIIIGVIVGIVVLLLLGGVAYIFLAPDSWPKPFNVRVETGADEDGDVQAQGDVSGTTAQPVAQPVAVQPATMTQPGMPAGSAATGVQPMMAYMQTGQFGPGIMYELDTQVVNLAEPGGLRYLQATVVLELWPLIDNYYNLTEEEKLLAEDEFKGDIDVWRPVINDIVITSLSSKSYKDIASVEGKDILKEELMTSINDKMGYQGVVNIYFTNFVIQ